MTDSHGHKRPLTMQEAEKAIQLGEKGLVLGVEGAGLGLAAALIPLAIVGGIIYVIINHKKYSRNS